MYLRRPHQLLTYTFKVTCRVMCVKKVLHPVFVHLVRSDIRNQKSTEDMFDAN